jgi:hypothetical protein
MEIGDVNKQSDDLENVIVPPENGIYRQVTMATVTKATRLTWRAMVGLHNHDR